MNRNQRKTWKQVQQRKKKGGRGVCSSRVVTHTGTFPRPSRPLTHPPYRELQGVVVWFGGVCFPTARWAKQAHVTGLAGDALRELCVVPCFYRVSL